MAKRASPDSIGPTAAPGAAAADHGPGPRPARDEPRPGGPGRRELSRRDYLAVIVRGLRDAPHDNVTHLAAAIAYNAFLAIPSALLVALGGFSLLAGQGAVSTIMRHLSAVIPQSAATLLGDSLTRTTHAHGGGIAMIGVGVVLALWSLSGAAGTVMWATNMAYEREETRGFLRKRLIALVMIACGVIAFALVFGLLVLGPHLSGWIGAAVGERTLVSWVWWAAQWPVLIAGLLATFGIVLFLAPNVAPSRWSFVSPGAAFAVAVWLAGSALFALYASRFGSYNKTWGTLSAVIVMLTWLWLSALALLLGAEINAEAERSRRLRAGDPAAAPRPG